MADPLDAGTAPDRADGGGGGGLDGGAAGRGAADGGTGDGGTGDSGAGPVVAAIDCGTNSTRLLVARREHDGSVVTLERLMRITRLGRGVDATGGLEAAAVDRTTEVLREYREVM